MKMPNEDSYYNGYIADVVALSEHSIATMRNLGVKTASEIAHWLQDHEICYSAWRKYL